MDEMTKALAEAVRAGSQLAWPALVMYFVSNAVSNLSIAGTLLGGIWLITRCILALPDHEAQASIKRNQAARPTVPVMPPSSVETSERVQWRRGPARE